MAVVLLLVLSLIAGAAAPVAAAEDVSVLLEANRRAGLPSEGDAGDDAVLTLEAVLRLTLEHSPRVQRAASVARQGAAALGEAESSRRPRIDVLAGVGRFQGTDARFDPAQPATGVNVGLSYRQVLADVEDTRLVLDSARVQARVAELTRWRETLAALADVVNAYVGVLEAQSALELSRVLERNATEALRVTALRFEEGTATMADLLAAQTAAERARQGSAVAASSLELAYEALFRAVGVPVPENGWPRLQPMSELLALTGLDIELDALRAIAERSNPEILQARLGLEAAKIARRQAERVDRPRFELTGAYNWTDQGRRIEVVLDDNAALGVTAVGKEVTDGTRADSRLPDHWEIGAQVRLNLGDGGVGHYRLEQAEERVTQAEAQLEELRAALSLTLARHYDEVVQALQEASLADADLLEATRRLRIVQQQAEVGAATRLDVWQAEGNVAAREMDKVRAEARVIRAQVSLGVAAGVDAAGVLRLFDVESVWPGTEGADEPAHRNDG